MKSFYSYGSDKIYYVPSLKIPLMIFMRTFQTKLKINKHLTGRVITLIYHETV